MGLSTLGFDPTRFQTKPPACYRASWQLPGRDSRLRINAVADDRRFVALEAAGSDETRVRTNAEGGLPQPRGDAEAGCAKRREQVR